MKSEITEKLTKNKTDSCYWKKDLIVGISLLFIALIINLVLNYVNCFSLVPIFFLIETVMIQTFDIFFKYESFRRMITVALIIASLILLT